MHRLSPANATCRRHTSGIQDNRSPISFGRISDSVLAVRFPGLHRGFTDIFTFNVTNGHFLLDYTKIRRTDSGNMLGLIGGGNRGIKV